MNRKYTDEQIEFLRETVPHHPYLEIARMFEDRFGEPVTPRQLALAANRNGIKRDTGELRWTEQMFEFMREIIPGHSEWEIGAMFEHRYGARLSHSQIERVKRKLGIKSETRQRDSDHSRLLPIGTESMQGRYWHVLTEKGWVQKSHIVWEKANGRPVPEHAMIIFADKDRNNFDPDNLVAVDKSDWVTIARGGAEFCNRETLEAAVAIAQLKHGISDALKRERPCRKCGVTFKPSRSDQKSCPSCLKRS